MYCQSLAREPALLGQLALQVVVSELASWLEISVVSDQSNDAEAVTVAVDPVPNNVNPPVTPTERLNPFEYESLLVLPFSRETERVNSAATSPEPVAKTSHLPHTWVTYFF